MTQKDFDGMPLLMRSREAREVLNLDRDELVKTRKACPEIATKLPGGKEWRYLKSEIARLAKLEFR